MRAKYFIYRNLHKNCFSVKFRGVVIDHIKNFVADNCIFKVNAAGRQRVILEQSKNVHAYVVCDSYDDWIWPPTPIEVTYNPYMFQSFVYADSLLPIYFASTVVGNNNKLYLLN